MTDLATQQRIENLRRTRRIAAAMNTPAGRDVLNILRDEIDRCRELFETHSLTGASAHEVAGMALGYQQTVTALKNLVKRLGEAPREAAETAAELQKLEEDNP